MFELEIKTSTEFSFPKLPDYMNQNSQYNYSRELEIGNWLIIYTSKYWCHSQLYTPSEEAGVNTYHQFEEKGMAY